MKAGTCLVKNCLCLFNFFFVVLAAAVLGLGIWIVVDQKSFFSLIQISMEAENTKNGSLALNQFGLGLIGLGAFIFVISFFGCCGTIKESRCYLVTYVIFLVLILIVQIVAVVLFFVYRTDAEDGVKQILEKSVKDFYAAPVDKNFFTASLDSVMAVGECCGINDYKDFQTASRFQANKTTGQIMPLACCKLESISPEFKPIDATCIYSPDDKNSNWKTGCADVYKEKIRQQMNYVIIGAVAIGLMEILGIIFALCVFYGSYDDDDDDIDRDYK